MPNGARESSGAIGASFDEEERQLGNVTFLERPFHPTTLISLAADLPAAVRFATDSVGLELVASDEQGVAHLRADARHHRLALVAGRSGVLASGFTVADDDALAGAERELERRGLAVRRLDAAAVRSRRVRSGIAFDDPFGNRLEFLERIREWGKKIVFIVNKIDILARPEDQQQVLDFVRENATALLGEAPRLFAVSARDALAAGHCDRAVLATRHHQQWHLGRHLGHRVREVVARAIATPRPRPTAPRTEPGNRAIRLRRSHPR